MNTLKLLQIDNHPTDGVRQLLDNNVIGTPGKSMVYQHRRAADKYLAIPRPFFVSLTRKQRVLGTCCFCERQLLSNGEQQLAYYVRYFTFHQSVRKWGDRYPDRGPGQSPIRREIEELLTGRSFGKKEDNFFYAYVDQGNERSRRLTESFGFRQVGSFSSLIFSRFNPHISAGVSRLSRAEWLRFKPSLLAFYDDHRLVTDENLFFEGNYYVVKKNDQVVAGLQANPEHWRVHDMPGFAGQLMMKIFPRVKFLSKVFNPDYRFVAVEGIFYESGHEAEIETLLNHVLAENGVFTAVICLDPSSRVYQVLKSMNPGLVGRLRRGKMVDVIAKTNGTDLAKASGPLYISALDVT